MADDHADKLNFFARVCGAIFCSVFFALPCLSLRVPHAYRDGSLVSHYFFRICYYLPCLRSHLPCYRSQRKVPAAKLLDLEADKSGSGHTTDEEDNDHSVDLLLDDSSQPNDDVDSHRQVFNRLRRTDSDQREFLLTAHNEILPDSPVSTAMARTEADAEEFHRHRMNSPSSTVTTADPPSPITAKHQPVDVDLVRLYGADQPNQSGWDLTPTPWPTDVEDIIPPSASDPIYQGKFRLQSRKIGLTYPKCPIKMEAMCDHLRIKFAQWQPQLIIVAMEDHKKSDGRHLHAYLRLTLQPNIRRADFFNVEDYHPNVKVINNEEEWLHYVCKGGNVFCYPPTWQYQDYVKRKSNHHETRSLRIATDIFEGATMSTLRFKYPDFMLLHQKQVHAFWNSHQDDLDESARRLLWSNVRSFEVDTPEPHFGMSDLGACIAQVQLCTRIVDWINRNIIEDRYKFRDENLWIYGATGLGKTSIWQLLRSAGCLVHVFDYDSGFWDGLSTDTQLLVFDEFKGQQSITQMNLTCDGSRTRFNVKGSTLERKKPLPVMVLSNYSIEECYNQVNKTDHEHLKTLIGRFNVLHVEREIRIKTVLKQL